jgi:hypothetical protein
MVMHDQAGSRGRCAVQGSFTAAERKQTAADYPKCKETCIQTHVRQLHDLLLTRRTVATSDYYCAVTGWLTQGEPLTRTGGLWAAFPQR